MQPARQDLPVTPGTTYRDTVRLMQPDYAYKAITAVGGSPLRLTVEHGLTADWPVWVRGVPSMPALSREPPQKPHRARFVDAATLEINALSAMGHRPGQTGELFYLLPVDLTGAQVRMPIMRGATEVLELTLGEGLESLGPGSMARHMTPEQTAQLDGAPASYWLEVIYANGDVIRYYEGALLNERAVCCGH